MASYGLRTKDALARVTLDTSIAPIRRDRESRAVLQQLGVSPDDILFVGRQLAIKDGQMHHHVAPFLNWLDAFFTTHANIHACFVPGRAFWQLLQQLPLAIERAMGLGGWQESLPCVVAGPWP